MKQHQTKLHPSSCFPPNPSVPNIQNRLFIRIAPNQTRYHCPHLTFVGSNATTYPAIAALLVCRPSTSIEYIKLFDVCEKVEARATLNDLRLIALFNKMNIHLEWAHSYWETKDSTIVIINVQHNQLENESISAWTQINASLVENIVSQVCIYSPHATLIICTEPNELMTYVAARVSQFPIERVVGLGGSVDTVYAHKTILDQTENVHGHINGYFVLGNSTMSDACAIVLSNHLTINGICCSDIYSKSIINKGENKMIENQLVPRKKKPNKDWDVLKILKNNGTVYSNISRQFPMATDLLSRQKTATRYLLFNIPIPPSAPKLQRSIPIPFRMKPRSRWTEAMLIAHIIRALIHDSEFQSNFAVNIAPINNSQDVFINYPTIIGSTHSPIKYMFPFHQAQNILQQRSFLIPYEKLQTQIRLVKSKD